MLLLELLLELLLLLLLQLLRVQAYETQPPQLVTPNTD